MENQDRPVPSGGGGSWTAESRALREDPAARFRLAYGHLPQKQAFREAAIALRALIREHCDNRRRLEKYLLVLYRIAALQSLVYSRAADHADDTENDEPSLAQRWERMARVPVPYQEVGSEALPLLTKTDRKLMAQLWGKPSATATPRAWLEARTVEPTGADEVAAFLRGDDWKETPPDPGADPPRRRASDLHPSARSESGGPFQAPPVDDSPGEVRHAEDAVFALMAQRRKAVLGGRRRLDLKRWASSLLGALGF